MEVLGLERPAGWEESLTAAAEWLRDALTDLLDLPFVRQRRGPLEVFQEAVRFPGALLAEAGAPKPRRDGTTVSALPGDMYDLAPASSRALGHDAWEAHVAWGVAKARSMTAQNLVALVTTNLLDRSKVEPAVLGQGCSLAVWTTRAEVVEGLAQRPRAALVDLTVLEAIRIIEDLHGSGVPVTAYGPHVDQEALGRARRAGAHSVLARGRFFRDLPDLI